jgi:thioredoxin reductase
VFDVVIIGAGPAGLSAALMLGRCRRRVIVCDSGTPRNAASRALHGFLTRDGMAPAELLRAGREEVHRYGIEIRDVGVADVEPIASGFLVRLQNGDELRSGMVLLATGVRDRLPAVEGIDECYGVSVFHCPYCDGWETRDRRIVALGRSAAAAGLAVALKTWSDHVVLCTDGRARLPANRRAELDGSGIAVREERVVRIEHERGQVQRVVLARSGALECDAIFFSTGQDPQSHLPRRLGCELTSKQVVKTDHLGRTCVPGLYVVGDASRDVQFAIVAAAEGAKAAVAINTALQQRSREAAAAARPG